MTHLSVKQSSCVSTGGCFQSSNDSSLDSFSAISTDGMFVCHFNYCRIHSAHKQTPAQAAGWPKRLEEPRMKYFCNRQNQTKPAISSGYPRKNFFRLSSEELASELSAQGTAVAAISDIERAFPDLVLFAFGWHAATVTFLDIVSTIYLTNHFNLLFKLSATSIWPLFGHWVCNFNRQWPPVQHNRNLRATISSKSRHMLCCE